jgi:hypothetical protein
MKSVVIALLFGPLSTFADKLVWIHNSVKYDPPISQSEMEQWRKLPATEMETRFAQRRISLSRMQWLADSVGYLYFWKWLAKSSFVPTIGIFCACLVLGLWNRPDGRGLS